MVVSFAAGESGTEKEKNPNTFSETINFPYNEDPRESIYMKKSLLVMDYELSIIMFKYSHY